VISIINFFEGLGPFLTAMTFDRIQVVHYMTKFSFLTGFFSVRLRAAKTPYLLPRGATSASIPAHSLPTIQRNLNIVCAVFKQNLNMMC